MDGVSGLAKGVSYSQLPCPDHVGQVVNGGNVIRRNLLSFEIRRKHHFNLCSLSILDLYFVVFCSLTGFLKDGKFVMQCCQKVWLKNPQKLEINPNFSQKKSQ